MDYFYKPQYYEGFKLLLKFNKDYFDEWNGWFDQFIPFTWFDSSYSVQLLIHIVCYLCLSHDYVDTMHLLLGLLQGTNSVVNQLLESQGTNVNKIREQVSHISS
jgi:hypothetical protein